MQARKDPKLASPFPGATPVPIRDLVRAPPPELRPGPRAPPPPAPAPDPDPSEALEEEEEYEDIDADDALEDEEAAKDWEAMSKALSDINLQFCKIYKCIALAALLALTLLVRDRTTSVAEKELIKK